MLSKRQQRFIKNLMQSKSTRHKNHCFIAEGLINITELLKSDYEIRYIVVSQAFLAQNDDFITGTVKALRTKFYLVSDALFLKLSDTISPQGILALVNIKNTDFENIIKEDFLITALDKIQDPGNMGTIIRTAVATDTDAILIGKGCVDIYNPKVVRAAMGSLFHISFLQTNDIIRTLNIFKKRGGKIVTTYLKAHKNYYDVDYRTNTVIVMGSEDAGVSKQIVNISDELVKIPMPGRAQSLNVGIAHGIITYEAVKQRI